MPGNLIGCGALDDRWRADITWLWCFTWRRCFGEGGQLARGRSIRCAVSANCEESRVIKTRSIKMIIRVASSYLDRIGNCAYFRMLLRMGLRCGWKQMRLRWAADGRRQGNAPILPASASRAATARAESMKDRGRTSSFRGNRILADSAH